MLVPIFRVSQEELADPQNWERICKQLKGLCVAGPAILRIDGEWWKNEALISFDRSASRSKQKPGWMMKLAGQGELMLECLPAECEDLTLAALDSGFLRVILNVGEDIDIDHVTSIVKCSNRERVAVRLCGPRAEKLAMALLTHEVPEDAALGSKPSDTAVNATAKQVLNELSSICGVVLAPLTQMPSSTKSEAALPKQSALTFFASAFRAALRPAKLLLYSEGLEDGDFPVAKLQAGATEAEADNKAVTERLVQVLHTHSRVSLAAPARVPKAVMEDDESDPVAASGVGASAEGAAAGGGGAGAGLSIGRCVALCARSDRPDGLFTTVVCDLAGVAMGLVYSSQESIEKAVDSMRGVYYSRTRKGLWEKGKTSGCYQELEAIRLDCDEDAVMVRVRQLGDPPAFCHHGTYTCWFENKGLGALERTLADRKKTAPAGSYTKKLMESPGMLKDKLVEESIELSEAATKDHVAAEAADLLYFALVRCADKGVTIADIEAHLDRRALKVQRRRGETKKYARDERAKREAAVAAAAGGGGGGGGEAGGK